MVINLSYFRSKSHFEDNGTQNYLVFQPVYRGGRKGCSFCSTSAKKIQNLWSPACKLINSAAAAFILILNFDPMK